MSFDNAFIVLMKFQNLVPDDFANSIIFQPKMADSKPGLIS